nr:MAG TPA: hypothetical protein [Caudoviricetes sp.]
MTAFGFLFHRPNDMHVRKMFSDSLSLNFVNRNHKVVFNPFLQICFPYILSFVNYGKHCLPNKFFINIYHIKQLITRGVLDCKTTDYTPTFFPTFLEFTGASCDALLRLHSASF